MKKILTTAVLGLSVLTLASCDTATTHDLDTIQIVSTERQQINEFQFINVTQEAFVSPTRIAVLNDSVLDILYDVGAFEAGNPLNLEMIMVSRKATHPMEQFREDSINGIAIHDGGPLHIPNEDRLEILQPQVVFLDHRSFAQNSDGVDDENQSTRLDAVRKRMSYTRFINLNFNIDDAMVEHDTTIMANSLSAIFPDLASDLQSGITNIRNGFLDARTKLATLSEDGVMPSAIWVSLNLLAGGGISISLSGTATRWSMIHTDFGFRPIQDGVTPAVSIESALVEGSALNRADFIFLFAHPNAPANAIDTFVNHSFITSQERNIIIINRAAWHTSAGGFSSTRTMINDVLTGIENAS